MRPSRRRCESMDIVEALARRTLDADQVDAAEAHLLVCEACRAHFRQVAADRLPKFRGYTIVRELGRGGFGVVYKAVSHSNARFEALKVLFANTTVREAYFENEVRLIAQLRHPNIATLYHAQLSGEPLYYAMEFVPGERLDQYLQRDGVGLDQRLRLIQVVIAAIGHAHRQGVVHRDLKPQNILVDTAGQPRLVDFGIAKRLDLRNADVGAEPQSPGGVLGTYGYIAPEQLHHADVDARADIYALGVLLYHIVTGEPPSFVRTSDRIAAVLRNRGVARAEDLAAIIQCCTDSDPERRYLTTDALGEDLDRFLKGRAVLSRRSATARYRMGRVAGFLLRTQSPLLITTVVLLMAVLISGMSSIMSARFAPAVAAEERKVELIGFMPSTLEAIRGGVLQQQMPGLTPADRKSWRLLYGRLLERLAVAQPRVVVWDYYFPDCRPEFDAALIRGIEAVGCPVVVATRETDVNGEPLLCETLRDVVHGWGRLDAQPTDQSARELIIPLAVVRGFNPPTPSLALAGFAAARFPDSRPDLIVDQRQVTVRYERRNAPPDTPRWRTETDRVPIFEIDVTDERYRRFQSGDKLPLARFPLDDVSAWGERAIAMERVLLEDEAWVRTRFAGRAVLVGWMSPPADLQPLAGGSRAFGCQFQASVLDRLLQGAPLERRPRETLVLRAIAWCAAGLLIGLLTPVGAVRRIGARVTVASAIGLLGLSGTLYVATSIVTSTAFEAAYALCVMGATAAPVWLIRLLRKREMSLISGPIWSSGGGASTLTTLTTASTRTGA